MSGFDRRSPSRTRSPSGNGDKSGGGGGGFYRSRTTSSNRDTSESSQPRGQSLLSNNGKTSAERSQTSSYQRRNSPTTPTTTIQQDDYFSNNSRSRIGSSDSTRLDLNANSSSLSSASSRLGTTSSSRSRHLFSGDNSNNTNGTSSHNGHHRSNSNSGQGSSDITSGIMSSFEDMLKNLDGGLNTSDSSKFDSSSRTKYGNSSSTRTREYGVTREKDYITGSSSSRTETSSSRGDRDYGLTTSNSTTNGTNGVSRSAITRDNIGRGRDGDALSTSRFTKDPSGGNDQDIFALLSSELDSALPTSSSSRSNKYNESPGRTTSSSRGFRRNDYSSASDADMERSYSADKNDTIGSSRSDIRRQRSNEELSASSTTATSGLSSSSRNIPESPRSRSRYDGSVREDTGYGLRSPSGGGNSNEDRYGSGSKSSSSRLNESSSAAYDMSSTSSYPDRQRKGSFTAGPPSPPVYYDGVSYQGGIRKGSLTSASSIEPVSPERSRRPSEQQQRGAAGETATTSSYERSRKLSGQPTSSAYESSFPERSRKPSHNLDNQDAHISAPRNLGDSDKSHSDRYVRGAPDRSSSSQTATHRNQDNSRQSRSNDASIPSSASRSRSTRRAAARETEPEYDNDTPIPHMFDDTPVDESIIIPDYIKQLIRVIQKDPTPTPEPIDFVSSDGYASWKHTIGGSFQSVVADLLKARFIDQPAAAARDKKKKANEPPAPKGASTSVSLFFKIVSASDLHSKEGRPRDAYASIEFGDIKDLKKDRDKKDRNVLQTQVIKGNNNPVWNQHMHFDVKNLTDAILVCVYDERKDDFLGHALLNIGELITASVKEGYLRRSYPLLPREGKKDKHAGGSVFIEVSIDNDKSNSTSSSSVDKSDRFAYIQSRLVACKVNFRSLYKLLLRNCLALDMRMDAASWTDRTVNLLSTESRGVLKILGKQWVVGEAFQIIAYLELLFHKYKSYEIPTQSLRHAQEIVHSMRKKSGWLSSYERPILISLLEEMYNYYHAQITKYKEFYPKNQPRGALETTIFMLRMIHKNAMYQEAHPDMNDSFREVFRQIMTEACTARYQKLSELTAPLDESDIEAVIEGLMKLADLIVEEIEADSKFFMRSFERELDITRLTTESYFKYFILTLENHSDVFSSEDAVLLGSKNMFSLYKKLRVMDDRYAKYVPSLRRLSMSAGFNIEKWFGPFIINWLDHLSTKTLQWVDNAIKADNYEPVAGHVDGRDVEEQDRLLQHSSSISDLFTAVYQELEFIVDLGWGNMIQRAAFFQKFAKTVNIAIEQYCDAVALGEIKADNTSALTWSSLSALANRSAAAAVAATTGNNPGTPSDITRVSCVKLCNMEYALGRLDDMYRVMNVASLSRTQRDHRATTAPGARQGQSSRRSGGSRAGSSRRGDERGEDGLDEDANISGQFQIQILYAENIKPANKNGLSNPYVIVRVPDGTVALESTIETDDGSPAGYGAALDFFMRKSNGNNNGPRILSGKDCELARSRVVYDSLNASWDEIFECILVPVDHLEIQVFSKNLLTSDEILGSATVDVSLGTRLRTKLMDHQTHDVYIEMEPQGRILLRFTLEGNGEDVDYWFRRSRERLGRTRDDFVRSLVSKMIPYTKEVLTKAVKTHEAAPAQKGFFSSLTTATEYTNVTVAGVSIQEPVSAADADEAMAPLTDYFNKNLSTLCETLSTRMAVEVIKRTWDESVVLLEYLLVPDLFGQIEKDRKVLNLRQTNMIQWCIRILMEFFHADGQELGLPKRVLKSRRYVDVSELVEVYHETMSRLRSVYERYGREGKDKHLVLRLFHFKTEKLDDLSPSERDDNHKWFEDQLINRREFRAR